GRFAKHFDKDGRPSATLFAAREDRLRNWHVLQELAGLARKEGVGAASAGAGLKPS
ncbi:MAG: hypothetical protein HYZ53_30530, partial [Planctomycetes bacterium]|nr:hypothetical protein [Planctomycetota bacterium]